MKTYHCVLLIYKRLILPKNRRIMTLNSFYWKLFSTNLISARDNILSRFENNFDRFASFSARNDSAFLKWKILLKVRMFVKWQCTQGIIWGVSSQFQGIIVTAQLQCQ